MERKERRKEPNKLPFGKHRISGKGCLGETGIAENHWAFVLFGGTLSLFVFLIVFTGVTLTHKTIQISNVRLNKISAQFIVHLLLHFNH